MHARLLCVRAYANILQARICMHTQRHLNLFPARDRCAHSRRLRLLHTFLCAEASMAIRAKSAVYAFKKRSEMSLSVGLVLGAGDCPQQVDVVKRKCLLCHLLSRSADFSLCRVGELRSQLLSFRCICVSRPMTRVEFCLLPGVRVPVVPSRHGPRNLES
jgi:hypothetical protein